MSRVDWWLQPVDDTAAGMSFALDSLSYAPRVDRATVQRAGGGFVSLGTPGIQQVAKVALDLCTTAQTDRLMAWYGSGETLCVLGPDGRKFWGVIESDATFSAAAASLDWWAVPLTIAEVSYSDVQ